MSRRTEFNLQVFQQLPEFLEQSPPATPSMRAEPATGGTRDQMSSRLQGSLLIVEGKPFTPCAIQWQGEPLQFLARSGFNAIQLPTEPTAEQSAEAQRLGQWFLGVPPRPDEIRRRGLGQLGDRVIAWYLDDAAFNGDIQLCTNLGRSYPAARRSRRSAGDDDVRVWLVRCGKKR